MSFFFKLSVEDIFGRHSDLEVRLGEKYFLEDLTNLYNQSKFFLLLVTFLDLLFYFLSAS